MSDTTLKMLEVLLVVLIIVGILASIVLGYYLVMLIRDEVRELLHKSKRRNTCTKQP